MVTRSVSLQGSTLLQIYALISSNCSEDLLEEGSGALEIPAVKLGEFDHCN